MKKWNRRIGGMLFMLSAGAAFFCGALYLESTGEYGRGEADLRRLYALVGEQRERAETKAAEENGPLALIADYAPLLAKNPDVAGWLRIEGTPVDYPVMCTPSEPDFYLDHGFDRKVSAYGMIYMDAACAGREECRNVLLYGHHMKNKAMFGALEQYVSKEFGRTHAILRFDTLKERGIYEVAGVFRLPGKEITEEFVRLLSAETREEYEEFVRLIEEKRLYDTGTLPKWPQDMVTLMTCEYTEEEGRLFVAACRADTADAKNNFTIPCKYDRMKLALFHQTEKVPDTKNTDRGYR